MKILKLELTQEIQGKILRKHGIRIKELRNAFENGNPRFFIIRGNIYLALLHDFRYISLIFRYKKPNIAKVITAYPSHQAHINRYNKK